MDNIQIVLGSKSPRRKELVKHLGFPVIIRTDDVEETYPADLSPMQVPEYLAILKAQNLKTSLEDNELLITSDTVVLLDGEILGKPKNRIDAINMITRLSGRTHDVISGVYMTGLGKETSFQTLTRVEFDPLTTQEIESYVDGWEPYDKAGAYGIQEWIGYIGVKGIEGCYYNVMGLPVNAIYKRLKSEFGL